MKFGSFLGYNEKAELIQRAGVSALVFLGAFVLTFFSVSNFAPASDSSATDVDVTHAVTGDYLNLTTLGEINLELSAGMSKVVKDTVSVGTNSSAGYKIYISSTDMEGSDGPVLRSGKSKTIERSSGTTKSPAKLTKNSWGYAPSRTTNWEKSREVTSDDVRPDSDSEVMIGIPEYENANTLYENDSPLEEDNDSVDIYYGFSLDGSVAAGQYTTSILYTAINEPESGSDASIAPANQKGLAAGQEVTIATDLYPGSIEDLGAVTVKIGDKDCTDITPMISESANLNIRCKVPAQTKHKKYDIIVTVENYHRTFKISEGYEYIYENIGIMQDFDCFSIDINEEAKLRDIRDGTIYRVKRAKDGNCWMLDDLAITGPRTLTPEDTDIPDGEFALGASDNERWCSQATEECYARPRYLDARDYGLTVYYNWHAATAGTLPFAKGHDDEYNYDYIIGGTATGSICPKGWHLPSGKNEGRGGEFTGLALAYISEDDYLDDSSIVSLGNPIELGNGVKPGALSDNLPGGGASFYAAEYWTDTASGSQAYQNYYWGNKGSNGEDTFSDAAGRDVDRANGLALRCFSSDTMYRFSCSDIPEIGGTKELLDFRNGTTYTVVKAKDGKCWTTRNQRLVSLSNSKDTTFLTTIDNKTSGDSITFGPSNDKWCEPNKSCSTSTARNILNSDNPDYGTYYNWYIALSWKNNLGTGVSDQSFCPENWRAPTTEDWQELYDSYGSIKALLKSPLDIKFAGYHLGSETLKEGKEAYFWTANYDEGDKTNGYNAFHISKDSYGFDKYNGYYGFNLRCIARN